LLDHVFTSQALSTLEAAPNVVENNVALSEVK